MLRAHAEIELAMKELPLDSMEHRLLGWIQGAIYAIHEKRWSAGAFYAGKLLQEMPESKADAIAKRAQLAAYFASVEALLAEGRVA